MSKIKNGGLDQYGAEPFQQQQFGTAGVEGVNVDAQTHKEIYSSDLYRFNAMYSVSQSETRSFAAVATALHLEHRSRHPIVRLQYHPGAKWCVEDNTM